MYTQAIRMKGICFSFLMCHVSMWASLWRRSADNLTGWFFPSMTWVLGIEVRTSGLAASALTQLSHLASLEGHNFLIMVDRCATLSHALA